MVSSQESSISYSLHIIIGKIVDQTNRVITGYHDITIVILLTCYLSTFIGICYQWVRTLNRINKTVLKG